MNYVFNYYPFFLQTCDVMEIFPSKWYIVTSGAKMSLFRNDKFMLDEMTFQNTSKFAMM